MCTSTPDRLFLDNILKTIPWQSLLDGILKVIPSIIAAIVAIWLWKAKEDKDRTNDAIRACWNLSQFCELLAKEILNDPSEVNYLSVESLNKYLDIYFDLNDLNKHLTDIFSTYSNWKRRSYFRLNGDEPEVSSKTAMLKSTSEAAEKLARKIAKSSRYRGLTRMQLSSLLLDDNDIIV
jgi:hypothetical protein